MIDSTDAWGRMLSIGNAELAVRLGAPTLYSQSGRVIFADSFEYGLQHWTTYTSGTGAIVALSPTYVWHGGYAVQMTGGSTASRLARLRHNQGLLPRTAMGFCIAFSIYSNVDRVELSVVSYSGSHSWYYGMAYSNVDHKLLIQTGPSTWATVGDARAAWEQPNIFNQFKFSVDLVNQAYGSCWFNEAQFDLSGYDIFSQSSSAAPRYDLIIDVYSRSGHNDTVYLDSVIVTTNEP